ncbi:MAG: hypothetical protein ACFFFT_00350 [Candidatus Thorarchaeota archaeon]
MAIKNDSFQWDDRTENKNKLKTAPGHSIEKYIINFLKHSHDIPKKRLIIARNQIFSLYRRMKIYPEKKALCKVYADQIIQIIKLERGNKK